MIFAAGVTLDIKKSSYKKLSKMVAHFASKGLWTAKEDKRTKELQVCCVGEGCFGDFLLRVDI